SRKTGSPSSRPRARLLHLLQATEASMTTIPHRQLRNESSKILERVKNGETTATLIPPASSPFERLLRSGAVRQQSTAGPVDFTQLERVQAEVSTEELLDDLRG